MNSKQYEVSLQDQIDEINKMIYKNIQIIVAHYKAPVAERTLTSEQLLKMIERTKLMAQCVHDIESYTK